MEEEEDQNKRGEGRWKRKLRELVWVKRIFESIEVERVKLLEVVRLIRPAPYWGYSRFKTRTTTTQSHTHTIWSEAKKHQILPI